MHLQGGIHGSPSSAGLICRNGRNKLTVLFSPVMGSKSRRFAEVFARAQEILRKTFGMELVELQNRVEEPSEKDKDPKDDKKQQKDKAAPGIKKKGMAVLCYRFFRSRGPWQRRREPRHTSCAQYSILNLSRLRRTRTQTSFALSKQTSSPTRNTR